MTRSLSLTFIAEPIKKFQPCYLDPLCRSTICNPLFVTLKAASS
jgi:hypothetical protein